MRLFEDAGIIERHDFREGRARYEPIPESHHDHLINLRTGEVIEFRSEDIERLQTEIARKLGYRLVDHRLELYAVPLDDESPPLMLRVALVGGFFFTTLPFMIALQWLLAALRSPLWGPASVGYYALLRKLLRINLELRGEPVRGRPVLIVANHVSWVDIVVLASIAPMVFVAKREVSTWPLIGAAARVQKVVFVDRVRRHQTAATVSEIGQRLGRRPSGGAVRGRHIERRQSCAAVPHGVDRRDRGRLRRSQAWRSTTAADGDATRDNTACRWGGKTARWSPGMATSIFSRISWRSCAAARSMPWLPSAQPVAAGAAADRKVVAKSLESSVARHDWAAALRPETACQTL